jgi:hypothetical protein
VTGGLPRSPATLDGCMRLVDDDHDDCVIVVSFDRPYPADQAWVATPYWIAPAGWLRLFFDDYAGGEHPGRTAPGVWLRPSGNAGTLRALPTSLSDSAAVELARNTDPASYTRPLDPVVADGQHVHMPCDSHHCGDLAVFTGPDGEPVAVRGDWLGVFTGAGHPEDLPSPDGFRWAARSPQHTLTLRQQPGGTREPIGVFLDRIRVHARCEDPATPVLAAVIMPHLLPGQPQSDLRSDPAAQPPMPLADAAVESIVELAGLDLEAMGGRRECDPDGC